MTVRKITVVAALATVLVITGCSGESETAASTPATTTSVAATYSSVREQDAAYLDRLDKEMLMPTYDTDLAVHRAGEICSSLESGTSKEAEIQRWANGSGFAYGLAGAKTYVGAAIDVYCPEYR